LPDLLEPVRFRNGVTARNRVALAPLTNRQSPDAGMLSAVETRWLLQRAEGGFGLVTTCATAVSREGITWSGELEITRDEHVAPLAALATGLRDRGALGILQLFHGGLRAEPAISGVEALSASEPEGDGAWRVASEDEIARVIEDFRLAAVRAVDAGFDGVEVHGAHGYLPAQFLSRVENRRDDRWGGSADARALLLREIVRGIRRSVPDSFVVGARISPEDLRQSRGIDVDESVALARGLADDGVDCLHVSLWDFRRLSQKHPDRHPLTMIRDVLPSDLPVLAAGKVWTAEDARAVLALGADVVALGLAAIANPRWPIEVAADGAEPQRAPFTRAQLAERGVTEPFEEFIREQWPWFLADAAAPVDAASLGNSVAGARKPVADAAATMGRTTRGDS
jgi:2,4-dienoyl-CoA reductase-like NADH-dependent reductase (Old Yellow Enzyme family)